MKRPGRDRPGLFGRAEVSPIERIVSWPVRGILYDCARLATGIHRQEE